METDEELIDKSTDQKLTGIVPYFKLYKYSTWLDVLLICVGTISSIICGIMRPYTMILFGEVIEVMANYTTSIKSNITYKENDGITEALFSGTQHFAIKTSISAGIIIVCTYISVVCFTYSSLRQTFKIRKVLFENALDQDISWYDQNKPTDFGSIITNNVNKIQEGIGAKVGTLIYLQTSVLASIMWAIMKGEKFAIVCLVLLYSKSISILIITTISTRYSKDRMKAYSAAGNIAKEVLRFIKTVTAFDGQEKESQRYEHYVKQAQNDNVKSDLSDSIGQAFYWFLTYGGYALALWYGIGLVIEERSLPVEERIYTLGNTMGIFFAIFMAGLHSGKGGLYFRLILMTGSAAHKVFKLLDGKPIIKEHSNIRKRPDFMSKIVINNVTFSYPSRPDVQVLKNIDININFGETIALVGHTGSGKSTIVELLQRVYDPVSGLITIGGTDLKDIDLSYLRQNIGVVSQEPSLFSLTVADNIQYGKLHTTMDEIVEAAKKANAHSFISKLPDGYQTVIGETGAQLSSDQKQRIALARALINKPKLLILDEAASVLDSASELEVQAAFDSIKENCTKIIITHRLCSTKNAVRIIVLDKGNIVDEGSHDKLIEAKGAYYNMFHSQELTEQNKINKNDDAQLSTKISSFMHYEESQIEDKDVIEEKEEVETETYKNVLVKTLQINRPEWLLMVMGYLAFLVKCAALPLYGLILGDILGVFSITDDIILRSTANSYCINLLYLGIAVGIAVLLQVVFGYAGEKLIYRLRNNMFSTMLKQEMGWFDKKENGVEVLCTQLFHDPTSVQNVVGPRIRLIMNAVLTFLLSMLIGFYLAWQLALIAGFFFPLIILLVLYEKVSVLTDAIYTQRLLKKSTLIASEAMDNIKTVKALGFEGIYYFYLKELFCWKETTFRASHQRGIILGCARSLHFFAYAGGIAYGAYMLSRQEVDSASIFKVLEVLLLSAWSIGHTLALVPDKEKGISAASRIFALFERVPLIKSYPSSIKHQWENPNIKFSRIQFSYPTRPLTKILNGLDLSITYGKTVALVGDSNCGKSSIIQLLMRFYDPVHGEVNVDGNDLRNLDLRCLRSQLGLVSQELNLFNLTIAENIGYGVNDRNVLMTEIEEAAKSANIHNFIAGLPLGYETIVGAQQLSEGQKWRIAIARALLRHPKILLLHEATSALDDESEKAILEVLDKAKEGRTCILITHRPATIQKADVIYFLKGGQVAEMGSHDQLLSVKGQYYTYYKLHLDRH